MERTTKLSGGVSRTLKRLVRNVAAEDRPEQDDRLCREKPGRVTRNPGQACVEKVPECEIFSQFMHFVVFLAGMLAE